MIIRRKPIGFDGLRKPRSLGMSLLRDSIQRMHNHTVQRVSPSDEPLSAEVSDFASDDFDYGDNAAFDGGDAAEFADYGDSADDGGLDAAIRRAEAPTPGQPDRAVRRTPRSTTNAKNTGNRPVQRSAQPQKPTAKPSQQPKQPAPPASQSVQRTPASPEPASSGAFKRQQLDQGDTMPRDLSSIMNLHRERAGGNVHLLLSITCRRSRRSSRIARSRRPKHQYNARLRHRCNVPRRRDQRSRPCSARQPRQNPPASTPTNHRVRAAAHRSST
jgi:hypothetical protein